MSKFPKPDGEARPDRVAGKNTECGSLIRFKLLGSPDHTHSKECTFYNLEIELNYSHNHSVLSSDALRYQTVTEDTKTQFIDFFASGHRTENKEEEKSSFFE